ncbi:MAG: RNA polymerase sigma factor [bacterium]|nr:RNA polymerase sigma factor [bacterium]
MVEEEDNLIQLSKDGDAGSFGELYSHYLPQIYRFVVLKVSQRQLAEDLTHEVFMSAWQNIGRYASQGFPFSSWLYQIARNRVIDHYRTQKHHSSIDDIDEDVFRTHGFDELKLDNELDIKKIRQAMKHISPEQQDVILMKFVEDLSHQEIAAALDKSEGAIRLLQHRGINKLKDILIDDDGTENN